MLIVWTCGSGSKQAAAIERYAEDVAGWIGFPVEVRKNLVVGHPDNVTYPVPDESHSWAYSISEWKSKATIPP